MGDVMVPLSVFTHSQWLRCVSSLGRVSVALLCWFYYNLQRRTISSEGFHSAPQQQLALILR